VNLDIADPNPGYTNFGGIGSNTAKLISGWVPGSGLVTFPSTMGIGLIPGARIVIQIHYPATAAGKLDSTRLNLKFNTHSGVRNVSVAPILNHVISLTDGPLSIPADSVKTFHEHYKMPGVDVSILNVAPHAHLVCTSMKAYAVTPAHDTIPLIDIPRWDFHWQGGHPFRKVMKIPANSDLYGVAVYNNTVNNPSSPRPLQTVNLGEATTDEMMLFYFSYLLYQSGDENIIIDTTSHEPHYMNCISSYVSASTAIDETEEDAAFRLYPNPVQGILTFESTEAISSILIADLQGKMVKEVSIQNQHKGSVNTVDLATGLYLIRLQSQDGTYTVKRFIKE
jgi:hypothetical protein